MRILLGALGLLLALVGVAPAQIPAPAAPAAPAARSTAPAPAALADLLKPPPEAERFTILSVAGKHGVSSRWRSQDGELLARESFVLRGQVFEIDSRARRAPDGMLQSALVRGFTPNGDAAESFSIVEGRAQWKSPVDAGSSSYVSPAMYAAFGGPVDLTADLVEALVAAPGHSLALLPGGRAEAEKLTETSIGEGESRRHLIAYAVTGIASTPIPFWVDDQGRFFGTIFGLAWLKEGYEGELLTCRRRRTRRSRAARPRCSTSCCAPPRGPWCSRTCAHSSMGTISRRA
jgi:hypothetical protein